MAEKRIFSRLNRWWRNPGEPGAADPSAPGPEGGVPASGPDFGGEMDSAPDSPPDLYPSDILPPEVVAAGQEALEAEIENLTRKLETKQKHLEGLLEQRNELHQQLRAAQESLAALETELRDRQSQTEAAASAQLEYLAKSNQHLIAERDAALNRLKDLGSKLTQNQAGNEALLRERDARITALEADLAARSRSADQAAHGSAELAQRITALEQELERARASQQELEHARQETRRALSLANEAADAHKHAEARVAALEQDLERARALALEAEAARKRSDRQAADLEAQLAEAGQALVAKLQQEAAATSSAPAPVLADSVDLTSELQQAGAAAPEPPPTSPQVSYPPPEESSEPATFEFVPAPEEPAPEPVAQEPIPEPPVRQKKLILIAEDDPSIRRLVELTLQKAGLDVITAEDGEDAFQKAITERPDAVLTDMMMPRMNGLELTSNLKKTPLTARIPIGFLTAQRELEYYKGALDLGSTLYITKPFRPDNLVTLVNLLLSGKKKPRPWRK
ncbi:MAG: response regulator [Candidatus Acidiferrales bacterium]